MPKPLNSLIPRELPIRKLRLLALEKSIRHLHDELHLLTEEDESLPAYRREKLARLTDDIWYIVDPIGSSETYIRDVSLKILDELDNSETAAPQISLRSRASVDGVFYTPPCILKWVERTATYILNRTKGYKISAVFDPTRYHDNDWQQMLAVSILTGANNPNLDTAIIIHINKDAPWFDDGQVNEEPQVPSMFEAIHMMNLLFERLSLKIINPNDVNHA